MKIYLFLPTKIIMFSLPFEKQGSYSFDENPNEESKLINIEAKNNEWILYSTGYSSIMSGDIITNDCILQEDNFYYLKRNNQSYLIYTSPLFENNLQTFSYNQEIDLIIGKDNNCNLIYNCDLLTGLAAKIHYENNQLIIEKDENTIIYKNNQVITNPKSYILIGDQINIYGLKIIFIKNLILINNPGNKLTIQTANAKLSIHSNFQDETPQNIEIKDIDLYKKDDYFSKSPRIRRVIETKKIKLSPPPDRNNNDELPMILTIGPMLTMGMTSIVTIINTVNKISLKQTTMEESWTSLVTSGAMLISMLLWPIVTNLYNKKRQKIKKEEIKKKYGLYLEQKKQELTQEVKNQKDILLENLKTVEDCLNIIQKRNLNFWDKRIEQNDFLMVRIGKGNALLDVEIEYPEEGFTIEEDDLKKQADLMKEQFKYIEDVPIGYSFYTNKLTAIMGNHLKSQNFINNIILQLITFYSYEDLKLVVLTNENNKNNWNYIKYLNHNFTNQKDFRFFASTTETSKNVAEFFNNEVSARIESKKDKKEQNTLQKPYYLIIIDDYDLVKRYDFIKTITETDENLGFSIIILEERLSKLPSKCNNFISLGSPKSGILQNTYDKQEQISFTDEINYSVNMMNVSKILSNIPIAFENGTKSLPDSITFLAMERVGKVEQLNIQNRWTQNNSTTSLKAEVGVDEEGDFMYLDLHEKYHGPHGLIAGTTGSGKSEFIITYILSMAINYSPDDVAFILIDYKGGGLALAFENKKTGVSLPHLAGTITNLDKAEMDRTLVSIDSEVKRRQRMFNEARDKLGESTIDIYKYQRFFKEGKLTEPIPHLFIICDEFAELKSQQPEFMDNLISVARIGRSLGVHLILATQKPSGVVNDQIWSNSKFKVCLKVQDEADSKEMLKRPEAASIKQAGRFYLQVGYDEYFALGQSGWCGAKYYPSEKIVKQVDKSINIINDCGESIKTMQDTNTIKIEAQGEQIAAIMKSIIEIATKLNLKAKRLWLDNIPPIILVDNLEKKYNIVTQPYNVEAIIGEYDAPEKQEQGVVKYNYLADGNTIIYGTDGSEREMLLSTLIYATSKNHTAQEINYYIIDFGSESLRKYRNLPQIGGMVFAGEEELYNNLFKLIKEEIEKRKKLFVDYGGEYQNYIKNNQNKLPLFVVIMNNFDSIFEANQSLYDELPELVRDSERYGIIYIITANAINSVSSKISQNFPNNYAFRMKDPSDYMSIFGTRTKLVPRDIEGRGALHNDGVHEFQTANIVENKDEENNYLTEFIKLQNQSNQTKAKRIPVLPNIVRLPDVQQEISTLKNIPIGINKQNLDICTVDYISNIGSVISSNKLANTEKFIRSLIYIFSLIKNINLVVIDPMKLLMLPQQQYPNYYNDNLDEVLEKLNGYITNLIEQKATTEGIILIYGVNKFITKIEDPTKFEELTKNLKKYEKIGIIIIEELNKIKNYNYESWYTNVFSGGDGLWIGRGVSDQSLFKISSFTKEMTKEIKNNMGYYISEGIATQIKLLDFLTKDEEENNGK